MVTPKSDLSTNNAEKFFVDLSAKLIQDNFEKILKKIFDVGDKTYKTISIKSKKAFEKYFTTSINKYIQMKTILYRDAPVSIYNLYVHLDLFDNKERTISTSTINNLTSLSHNILITGTAGCGKSTLIKHLFLNTIENQQQIPIFIELRNINETKKPLIDFIYDTLADFNFDLEKEYFVRLLESGKFILFFDGFDEVKPEKFNEIAKELLTLRDKYYSNFFIVTSRPDDRYVSWSNFFELKVQPLTKEKSIELISKIDYDQDVKKIFIKRMDDNLYDKHQSFASNPLLLTIMLMTFNEHADIPDKMHIFYAQAFETLFSKHDATKAGYKRIHYTSLPIDDFRSILSSFCLQTYFNNEINFPSEKVIDYLKTCKKITGTTFDEDAFFNDLLKTVCLLIRDGIKYTFTHRTFQEYFTALSIVYSQPELRKKLIQKLGVRRTGNLAIRLIFEIDRKILEEEYIIERLKEIRNETKFGEIDEYDSFFIYCKKCFEYFYVGGGYWGYKYVDIGNDVFMQFIFENYRSVYPVKYNDGTVMHLFFEYISPFIEELKKHPSFLLKLSRENLDGEEFATRVDSGGERFAISFSNIEKNRVLKDLFIKSRLFYYEYKYSMYVLENILKDHKNREESISNILLSRLS